MSILVTGATGLIGSRLVSRLVADGQSVIAIARNSNSVQVNTDPLIKWLFQDFTDVMTINDSLRGITAVVHLAGETLGAGEDEAQFLRANEQIVVQLLQALDSQVNHFVYASTQGVYGDAKSLAVTEEFPLFPTGSAYACSKLNSENWLRWFQKKNGGCYLALRFCGFIEGGGLVDYIINQALCDEQIELFANGSVSRDYLPVSDGIDAIVAALNYTGYVGFLPINIGSGQAFTSLELAKIICSELKSSSRIKLIDASAPQGDFVYSIERAKEMLGFAPLDLEKTIREYTISRMNQTFNGQTHA
jgi:nucleoside-diphosphate-sugar epimerase